MIVAAPIRRIARWAALLALASPAHAGSPPRIPLCAGLTIITAVNQPDGDYESIKRVTRVDANGIGIRYTSERKVVDEFSGSDQPVLQRVEALRSIRAEDQASAPIYLVTFRKDMPETIAQTTALGASQAVYKSLKTRNDATLGIIRDVFPDASLDKAALSYIYNGRTDYKLRRNAAAMTVSILVNGQPTQLPVIHATGDTLGDKVEFFFLDDPGNPLALKFRLGIGSYAEVNKQMIAAAGKPAYPSDDRDALRVVRISYDCADRELPQGAGASVAPLGAAAAMEQALADHKPVDVYDIFFSFNSAELRVESEPTLKLIGDLLKRHPDWRLRIGGHTDNIASEQFNLELSARRVAAVKSVLVGRFGITAARLLTQGYGKSQPRDSNETLEGRSRNRRVELQRL